VTRRSIDPAKVGGLYHMGDMLIQMKKEMKIDATSLFRGSSRYTKKSRNSWRKVKHFINLGMKNTGLIISSSLETRYGFTSARKD
jgi:hypothetical protein